MTDVFISHSYQDRPFVNRLANQLRDEGLSVWLDEESLLPGSDIVASLSQAIAAARAVLVVLGDRTVASNWMRSEAAIALSQKDKLVVPVVTTKSADVPFMLRHLKAVDLSDETRFADSVHRLASFLKDEPTFREQNPAARIERIAVESQALRNEVLEYSRIQTGKNIRLIAGATAIVALATSGAVALVFFKERLGFSDHVVSLLLGVAAGIAANLLYRVVKEQIAARLTKRTGGKA